MIDNTPNLADVWFDIALFRKVIGIERRASAKKTETENSMACVD